MRLGLYFDLRDPPRWRRGWPRVHAAALTLAEEADRRGIGSLWLSEHHFFEDGYLPQPLVFAAALAARTSRARIGTAVLLAPLRSPLTIAEEAAVVDTISDGRLELGLGAGYRVPEFEAFGVDGSRRLELVRECVVSVREQWAGGRVTPAPVQTPPTIWVGAHGPRAARIAGSLGAGLLSLDPRLWEPYREALAHAGHPVEIARISGPMSLLLADDPERALAIVAPHAEYQWSSYISHAEEGRAAVDEPFQLPPMFRGGAAPPAPVVLTVEQAAARLRALAERALTARLQLEHVFFWERAAGMPDELAQRHAELLLDELIPAVRQQRGSTS
ncbi:MAG: LLM class flavin-dependent oxidoreductase [Solirubrobacteraceae bacterium]